jgi:hypothetical protein
VTEWPHVQWEGLFAGSYKEVVCIESHRPRGRGGINWEHEVYMGTLAGAVIHTSTSGKEWPSSSAGKDESIRLIVETLQQCCKCKLNAELCFIDMDIVFL